MPSEKKKLLSVVVPSYKEGKTIKDDLESIEGTLKEGLPKDYDYEIICVEDGVFDNTSEEAAKVKSKKLQFYSNKKNMGKGYSVRFGMKKAKGDIVSFIDAGRDIRPKGLMMLMVHMDWYDADIIVGSKRHPASKLDYPFFRTLMSVVYEWMLKILFGLKLKDTQSGLKFFKRDVIDSILPKLKVDRFAMDIEMLALARHYGFKRIFEAPIKVDFEKGASNIQMFPFTNPNSPAKMIWDTLKVFYDLKVVRTYDK